MTLIYFLFFIIIIKMILICYLIVSLLLRNPSDIGHRFKRGSLILVKLVFLSIQMINCTNPTTIHILHCGSPLYKTLEQPLDVIQPQWHGG